MNIKFKYLILSLLIFLGGANSGNAAPAPVDPKVLHIINRLSFGPRPGDVQKVESIGVERYIQEQLSPDSIPESPNLNSKLSQLETLRLNPVALYKEYQPTPPNGQKLSPEEMKAARQKQRVIVQQAVQARLLRATQSPRQLQEVMVDFWFNHFNIYADKGLDRLWVGAYEQEAIRPHVLGHFRDLLEATARHPAMQFYLDNWQNSAPRNGKRGKSPGLNENYARELMELHTLGVDGGYSQQDVIALARILTGWGFRRENQPTGDGSGFYFEPKRHDFSDKVFLGTTIKGSGALEVEQALDILARSPATAYHISYQLAQYFVSDRPPSTLVRRLQERYLASDGNIREVLNTIFHSKEFWDSSNFNTKFKTPYEYVVSAVRATGIEVNNTQPMVNMLQQSGMPIYGCLTPDGYKNTQEAWLNPDALIRRVNFATTLASGRLPLSALANQGKTDKRIKSLPVDAKQLANTLAQTESAKPPSDHPSGSPQLEAALILGSPEFMRR